MKMLFLFCSNQAIDPVAPLIFHQVKSYYAPQPTSNIIANNIVLRKKIDEHELFFLQTNDFPSKIYPEIVDALNAQFSDVEMIGLINWHAGSNAPSKIFCAHSTADIPSGIFGPTNGEILAAILLAIEEERKLADLLDFRTLFEASHWSGPMYGRKPVELMQLKAPVFDIEIGSFPEDWENPKAQEVLVRALEKIPSFCNFDRPRALYLGGIHFEPSATEMVFQSIVIEHHLPNQWLVSGEYHLPGAELKLIEAAKSAQQLPNLIVFHAGLKAAYKECARKAAALLGIPCVSHKQLRAEGWRQTLL